jgi:acyl dehydratase
MTTGAGLDLSTIKEGSNLPSLKKAITQERIVRYAEASSDFNPIHVDETFAQQTELGGTIAHGMLIMSFMSQMMTVAFGLSWLRGGKLDVRFRTPARPGDTVTVRGGIRAIERRGQSTVIDCDVVCENQNGEPVITGVANVKVKTS